MGTEIEKLPRMIQRAASTLAKATTAAGILDARDQADVAYTAAKTTARLAKVKDAHDAVQTACRKVMADALLIDTQAQCRLADEYDAAQERGEVAKRGEIGRGRSSQREHLSSSQDIGLTRKQVHQARTIRDAERAKPGIVRKAVEEKLNAGKEPTRADVKRAVKGDQPKSSNKNSDKSSGRQRSAPKPHYREDEIITLLDRGLTQAQIAAETGVGRRQVRHVVEREMTRREARAEPAIGRADLSMSAQEKFDAAIRQYQKTLAAGFDQRVTGEVRRRIDEMWLPHMQAQIAEAKTLYERRKALMDKATFNTIRRALHPDSRMSISDKALAEAFDAFMALEKFLIDEKDSPTTLPDLPSSLAEWQKMRAKKSPRGSGGNSVQPRH